MKPVARLAELDLTDSAQGEFYRSRDASLTAPLGLGHLGVAYSEVPPGKSGCPFHNHHAEDEIFVVLAGRGVYRFGDERHEIGAGDVLGAPAGGRGTAHQIVNTGDEPLRFVAVSNRAAADVVEYPDSGKFQALVGPRENRPFRHVGRAADALDYWDGEPGA